MSEFDTGSIPEYIMHEAVREVLGDRMLSGGSSVSRPYNFRCPICGDSKKNPRLKRGFVLFNKDEWVFVCHNECGSMSFLKFLQEYHNDVFKRVFIHGLIGGRDNKPRDPIILNDADKTLIDDARDVFKPNELIPLISNHPRAQTALKWAQGRGIRHATYEQWYVCLSGEEFYDRDANGKIIYTESGVPKGNEYRDRVIIPYYKFGGKWGQFDARAISDDAFIRYRNLKGVERQPFNIDWLDVTKPFYLLEGAIDSTFINNSVAFGGTKHFYSLLREYPHIMQYAHNGTVIWDNDDAGYDMLPVSIGYGFNWFNWSTIKPSERYKYNADGTLRTINDINDFVLYTELVERDKNEYIKGESLHPFIESARGGRIITSLLYGDREAIRREKQKKIFDEMNEKRRLRETVKYSWE